MRNKPAESLTCSTYRLKGFAKPNNHFNLISTRKIGKIKCLPYGENMLSFKEVGVIKCNYEKGFFRFEWYASFNIIKHTYIILLKPHLKKNKRIPLNNAKSWVTFFCLYIYFHFNQGCYSEKTWFDFQCTSPVSIFYTQVTST